MKPPDDDGMLRQSSDARMGWDRQRLSRSSSVTCKFNTPCCGCPYTVTWSLAEPAHAVVATGVECTGCEKTYTVKIKVIEER